MNDNEIQNVSASDSSVDQVKEIDINPIKSIVKDKTSKRLAKGLQKKSNKPSWWIRTKRKKLVSELQTSLKELALKKHGFIIISLVQKKRKLRILQSMLRLIIPNQ